MKKVFAICIVTAFVMSSCSFYTCPTYAKKAEVKPAKEAKI